MKKLLVAEYSEERLRMMQELMRNDFLMEACLDGDTALELLQTFQPDILVLNMLLPGKDAITVLQETAFKPAYTLVYSHYSNPYVEQKLSQLDVNMLLLSPTPGTLRLRILELAREASNIPESEVEQLAGYLYALRFPTGRQGYRQLIEAILQFRQDPEQHLTKELYPYVANLCGCKSVDSVEHSIRTIIHDAWQRREPRVWAQYFPCYDKRPSNKEFISRMAYMLNQGKQ